MDYVVSSFWLLGGPPKNSETPSPWWSPWWPPWSHPSLLHGALCSLVGGWWQIELNEWVLALASPAWARAWQKRWNFYCRDIRRVQNWSSKKQKVVKTSFMENTEYKCQSRAIPKFVFMHFSLSLILCGILGQSKNNFVCASTSFYKMYLRLIKLIFS